MNAVLRRAVAASAIVISGLCCAAAQLAPEKAAFVKPKIAEPLPFKTGETLSYDIRFSRLFFSGTIGELRLSVSAPADPSKPEVIELRADAVSKGFFPSLFGIKVKDRYSSLVNVSDFGMQASTKLVEEGKVRREQKSVINRETGVVTFSDRDLANAKTAPKVKEKSSPLWVQDLVSTIYFVRTQPLKEGDVIAVPISDGGEVYNIEVIAGKRDEIKTGLGKFKTIQLNAKVFDGRYLKRSGEMLVWVTDDSNKVPLRARIKTSGSTISVDLKKMPEK